jgi:Holliday junction resolvasome RuvABC DNA-binding subunit
MQNNKKSKKSNIDELHDILDEESYKRLPSENKKYLKSLDRRLKKSTYYSQEYSKLVTKQVGKEEVSLEPKITIFLKGGRKRTEFPEVKKEDIVIKVEAVPTIIEEKPEKKPFLDEDLIEIEKFEYKEPQFLEVKPKEISKEEPQKIEKKAIGDEELTEWEEIEKKEEEKPEWEPLEEGVFVTTDEKTSKKPPEEIPETVEKFEFVSGFCGKCGTKLAEGDKFCPNCGINIEIDVEEEIIEEKEPEPVEKIKPEATFIPIEKVEEKEVSQEWEPMDAHIKSIEKEPKGEEDFIDKYNKIEIFKEIKSINDDSALLLYDKGYTTVESLKDVTIAVLVDVVGVPKKLAKKIKKEINKKIKDSTFLKPVEIEKPAKDKDIDEMIKEDVLSRAVDEPAAVELQTKTSEWEPIEDIEKEEFDEQKFLTGPEIDVFKDIKSIDKETAFTLYNNGFASVYSISMASVKDLTKLKGIKRKTAKEIKAEIDQKLKPIDIPVKKPIKVKKEEEEDIGEYFEEVEPEFVDIDAKIQEQDDKTIKPKGDGFFEEIKEEKPSIDEQTFEIIFKDIPSIDKKIAKLLIENGIDSIDILKTKTVKDLTRIRGIKKKIAKQIKKEIEKNVKVTEDDFEKTSFESVDEHLFGETTDEWESFDEKKISESEKKEIEGFMHGDYTLYEKVIETKDGKKRKVRFFSIAQPEDGEPIELPKDYEVKENKKTGLPYLKKKK